MDNSTFGRKYLSLHDLLNNGQRISDFNKLLKLGSVVEFPFWKVEYYVRFLAKVKIL
jgi:hypothetical protein